MDDATEPDRKPSFVVTRSNPPFLCPTAFKCLTGLEHFESWKIGEGGWQLRIVGSPGTGKTTLSTMVIQDLRKLHGPTAVAAIFIQAQSPRTPEEFTADVLESIYCQLTGTNHNNDSKLQTSEDRSTELRTSIYRALDSVPRAFLVIDDLDTCGYQSVRLIEEELDTLQKHGLRIMITSRITRYPTIDWSCDAEHGHSIRADCDVWFCSQCYQRAEGLEGEEREETVYGLFVTCTSCKEKSETERMCSNAHDPSNELCRPFNYAQLDLDEIMSEKWETELSDLALWTIQNEHGLINPGVSASLWPDKEWPPLTPIGESLLLDMSLVNRIVRSSTGNLTLSKLRLEEMCEADSLDSFRLVRDRLPRKVVSLFGSQIASVKGQAESVAKLGLSAIKLATKDPGVISFEVLQETLRMVEGGDGVGMLDMQGILHAAKGLLKSRDSAAGQHLEAYHPDFELYAIERYNEDLENHKI